jgi:hypothetical protein
MAQARNRGLVWLTAIAGTAALAVAVAGFRGWLPGEFAWLGMAGFVACLALISLVGWKTRQEMLALRDEAARAQMIVMLAARIRDEPEAVLEQMVRRGGPAGEAAGLILQGREERRQAGRAG